MIERGRSLCFLFESPQAFLILRVLAGKEFQRDAAAKYRVFRQVNLAHPARAELLKNAVVGDCLFDHLSF